MSTLDFLNKLLSVIDEAVFPLLAAWGIAVLRRFLNEPETTEGQKQ